MQKHKFTALLLGVIIASTAVSCGQENDINNETSTGTETSETTSDISSQTEKSEYEFPELDCGNDEFIILNSTTTWGFYTYLDFEEMTGETLDDAVYSRNRDVEDRFNVKLKIIEEDQDVISSMYQTAVLSGDDVYDAVYCRGDRLAPFILENYLVNLSDYPEFQLDKPWWDQAVSSAKVGNQDELYFASSDFQLFGFDATLITFFNERIADELSLGSLYDVVRDGKWTLSKMQECMKAAANLNGDESFEWTEDGSAVYGLTTWATAGPAFINGTGEHFIKMDESGTPYLAIENDRFYSVAEQVAQMLSTEGDCIILNGTGRDHYETLFKEGRALFLAAQLKASSKYRDMNDSYGILPLPKYDEEQENYSCYRTGNTLLLSIPTTNPDPARAGIILDALSYLSWRDVLPIYYNINVSQKALRNDDSIEMLSIIRDSRYFDISRVYGWCDELYNEIQSSLLAGNGNLASTIAKNKTIVEENIAKTLDILSER